MLTEHIANSDTPDHRPIDLERHIAPPANTDAVTSFDGSALQGSDDNAVSLDRERATRPPTERVSHRLAVLRCATGDGT